MRVVVLVLTLAACSEDSRGNFPNGCSGDYDNLMGAMCDLLSRCPDVYPLAYANRDECKAILCWATTCRLNVNRIDGTTYSSLMQTVPTVNTGAAEACLSYLGGVSCQDASAFFGGSSSTTSNPCSGVIGSTDSDNNNSGPEECTSSSCPDASFCQYGSVDVDAGVRTCSTCTPKAKEGESCSQVECADGLWCDGHFQDSPFICKTPQPTGATCYSNSTTNSPCQSRFCNFRTLMCDPNGNEGDACTSPSDCRSGYCNAQMTCDHLREKGESCTLDSECKNGKCDPNAHVCGLANGSSCSYEICLGYCDSATATCQSPRSEGSTCTSDAQCVTGYCAYVSFSSSTRACAVRCDAENPCPATQVCNSTSTCQDPKANGVSCDGDEECQSLRCNPNGVCGEKPQLGASCTSTEDCFPIGYCKNSVCTRQLGPGQACDSYDSCLAPYICLMSTCVLINLSCMPAAAGQMCAYLRVCDEQSYCDQASNFTCKPRLTAGATCSSDEQCEKTSYCNQTCVPRLTAGASCTRSAECADGVYCVEGTCTTGPAGQPCDQYDGPFCPDGYVCDNDACVAGTAQAGQSCSEFSPPYCAAGLACVSGMCKARLGLGESCDYSDQACLSGFCDNQGNICVMSDQCVMP